MSKARQRTDRVIASCIAYDKEAAADSAPMIGSVSLYGFTLGLDYALAHPKAAREMLEFRKATAPMDPELAEDWDALIEHIHSGKELPE